MNRRACVLVLARCRFTVRGGGYCEGGDQDCGGGFGGVSDVRCGAAGDDDGGDGGSGDTF